MNTITDLTIDTTAPVTTPDYGATTADLHAAAEARIAKDPQLATYSDILLGYDWSNADEHYSWIALSDYAEIIGWCADRRATEAEMAA